MIALTYYSGFYIDNRMTKKLTPEEKAISDINNKLKAKEYKINHPMTPKQMAKSNESRAFCNISEENRLSAILRSRSYYAKLTKGEKLLRNKKIREFRRSRILTDDQKSRNAKKITRATLERRLRDPIFKMRGNISCLIRNSFIRNGFSKTSITAKILGCTYKEFKLHIESQFEPWMNWSNYGNWNGVPTERNVAWDLDHKVPVSSATTKDDIVLLNHWSNFQPLCSYENRWVKSNKLQY